MELRGERVALRPLREDDLPQLDAIGREPEVSRWWPDLGGDARDTVADETGFAVLHEDEIVGFVQFWEESDPMYRHAAIDIALATRVHGRGLGRDAVRALARWLFDERGHHRITIDPAAANDRAIRCYESVGFRRVGVLRRYERGTDGTWHDGLLLDLLRDELR
jgi:aminoglycoside 6'-N-acetyltransferase